MPLASGAPGAHWQDNGKNGAHPKQERNKSNQLGMAPLFFDKGYITGVYHLGALPPLDRKPSEKDCRRHQQAEK
jgi:hypothetical protein